MRPPALGPGTRTEGRRELNAHLWDSRSGTVGNRGCNARCAADVKTYLEYAGVEPRHGRGSRASGVGDSPRLRVSCPHRDAAVGDGTPR